MHQADCALYIYTYTYPHLYVYNSHKNLASSHFTGKINETKRGWIKKSFKYTWSGSSKAGNYKYSSFGSAVVVLIYVLYIFLMIFILPGTRISQRAA